MKRRRRQGERSAARSDAKRVTPGSEQTLGEFVESDLRRKRAVVVHGTLNAKRSSWKLVEKQLGGIRLSNLNPDHVQDVLIGLLEPDETRPRNKGGYAPTTVQHVRALLCEVTAGAKARQRILHDPLSGRTVLLPKAQPRSRAFLVPSQLLTAWDALAGDELGRLLLALCGFMGLRRGEALALVPSAIHGEVPDYLRASTQVPDLHAAYVTRVIEEAANGEAVREYPKSPGSDRVVFMPSMVASTVLGATARRKPGESLLGIDPLLKDRLDKTGDEWTKRCFTLVAAGLPKVTLHELRHSYATLLSEARVYDFVARRLMGHVVPGMSAVYTHLTWPQLATARDDVDAYLAGIANSPQAGR